MSEERTIKYSTDDLPAKGRTRRNAPEGPEDLGPDFWANARIVMPDAPKEPVTIRIDGDVLAFFKEQGKGYQTRMNAVLRSYYEAARKTGH